jgi:hypothetical protein
VALVFGRVPADLLRVSFDLRRVSFDLRQVRLDATRESAVVSHLRISTQRSRLHNI